MFKKEKPSANFMASTSEFLLLLHEWIDRKEEPDCFVFSIINPGDKNIIYLEAGGSTVSIANIVVGLLRGLRQSNSILDMEAFLQEVIMHVKADIKDV